MLRKSKKKFAQQLVEFLLVAPFLIIILGILTEYAYALNCNATLSDGLKMVTGSIYNKINPNMADFTTGVSIEDQITADLRAYLIANNVPTRQENTLTVSSTIIGESAVFVANYKYISAFTLPNVFFHFLPDSFDFQAISIIPKSFIQGNIGYNDGISSTDLDKIWTGTNFSGLKTYDGVKNGAMSATLDDKIPILFLVKSNPPVANTYNIVTWDGTLQSDTLDMNTGKTSSGKNLLSAYPNCHTFIFVKDDEVPSDLAYLPVYWTHKKGTCSDTAPTCDAIDPGTLISNPIVDGILKRSLALINANSLVSTNKGNFDNIAVNKYNNEIAPTAATYVVDTFGSDVFVHFEDITSITNGLTEDSLGKDYNFRDSDKENYKK